MAALCIHLERMWACLTTLEALPLMEQFVKVVLPSDMVDKLPSHLQPSFRLFFVSVQSGQATSS